MLHRLLGRLVANSRRPRTGQDLADALYDGISRQARLPVFFRRFGFPDTVLGRLDVLHLHLFLFARRLTTAPGEAARELSQRIFDRHVAALDAALRQLGVGDLSVPKRKKRMVREFYGLIAAFGPPLDLGTNRSLADAANLRFFGGQDMASAERLARYAMSAADLLSSLPDEALFGCRVDWPDAERFS